MTDKLTQAEEACHAVRIAAAKALKAIKACDAYSPDALKFTHDAEDDLLVIGQILLERRKDVLGGRLSTAPQTLGAERAA